MLVDFIVCFIHGSVTVDVNELELFCRYITELLAERQKLVPFLQVLPFCYRLLNQGMLSCVSWLAVITSSCTIGLF